MFFPFPYKVFFLLSDPCDSGLWICLLRTFKEWLHDARRCCATWKEVHFLTLSCYSFLEILTFPIHGEISRRTDATEIRSGPEISHYLKLCHIVKYSFSHERGKKLEEKRAPRRAQKQSKIGPLCWSNSFNKINSFENLIISFCLFLLFDNQINTFWLRMSYINLP